MAAAVEWEDAVVTVEDSETEVDAEVAHPGVAVHLEEVTVKFCSTFAANFLYLKCFNILQVPAAMETGDAQRRRAVT